MSEQNEKRNLPPMTEMELINSAIRGLQKLRKSGREEARREYWRAHEAYLHNKYFGGIY